MVLVVIHFVAYLLFFVLMIRRPPISTRTDTLFPYTTLFRSTGGFTALVTAAMLLLAPVLIEPLFNDYKPVPPGPVRVALEEIADRRDRKSTRLNSSH